MRLSQDPLEEERTSQRPREPAGRGDRAASSALGRGIPGSSQARTAASLPGIRPPAPWLEEKRGHPAGAAKGPHGPETPHLQGVWQDLLPELAAGFPPKNPQPGDATSSAPPASKAFLRSPSFVKHQRTHTGRSPASATTAGRASATSQGCATTRRSTRGRSPTSAPCARRASSRGPTSTGTRGCTPARGPTSAPRQELQRELELDKHQRSHLGKKPARSRAL